MKERPLARGTAGLLGVRRAVLGGEPVIPTVEGEKATKVIALEGTAVVVVSCVAKKIEDKRLPRKKIEAKKMPRKVVTKKLQVGETPVSLSEDESEEGPVDVTCDSFMR